MQPSNHVKKIRLILRGFGSLLGVCFLFYQIASTVREFNWSSIAPNVFPAALLALCFTVFATTMQMIAWKVLLGGIGVNLLLGDVFAGFSLSFVARYIPGTVWGYLARGEWLKRDYQVPFALSNLGAFIETLGIITAVFVVVIIGMPIDTHILLIICLCIAGLLGSWAAMNLAFLLKPVQYFFRMQEKNIFYFPFLRWLVLVSLYIGMWYCFGMGLAAYGGAIDGRILFSQIILLDGIYAFAWFIGFIVLFLPSGLGLREYSLSLLFVANFGLDMATASSIALGFRLLVSLGELFWVVYGIVRRVLVKKNIMEAKE